MCGTNEQYDQGQGIAKPVRPEWVIGTAEFHMPGLGWLRLGVGTVAPTRTAGG